MSAALASVIGDHHHRRQLGNCMPKKPKGHLRRWRIILERDRGVALGTVEAESAEAALLGIPPA